MSIAADLPLLLAVTPGVGYLEALCEDNVSVVTSSIQCVVAEGIITADGVLHPLGELCSPSSPSQALSS